MAREINLDGAEITILKVMGLGSSEVSGEMLLSKLPTMNVYDLADVLKGMMQMGYIDADKNSFYAEEEFKKTNFHVNSGYAKDLRHALDPDDDKPKSRRVRRE